MEKAVNGLHSRIVDFKKLARVSRTNDISLVCLSCSASGIDLQSQEAYDLAVKGLIRAKPVGAEAGTVLYGIRCIEFDPPYFTLGKSNIYAINIIMLFPILSLSKLLSL